MLPAPPTWREQTPGRRHPHPASLGLSPSPLMFRRSDVPPTRTSEVVRLPPRAAGGSLFGFAHHLPDFNVPATHKHNTQTQHTHSINLRSLDLNDKWDCDNKLRRTSVQLLISHNNNASFMLLGFYCTCKYLFLLLLLVWNPFFVLCLTSTQSELFTLFKFVLSKEKQVAFLLKSRRKWQLRIEVGGPLNSCLRVFPAHMQHIFFAQ